ncbi:ABC-type sugar transport system, ATPase component [Hoeflea phototrophica DFL-43]|uniref:ABC-type sugar transport system, ATPase component n=1 Tax=Hoeflea phototrophica (strain DSM 17068 / NCIMB 14078 / DFL-43) TaxID=411684 RepID=A9CXK7_HOEPD|nr:ABC transporter ATP-binding protein [Hoeflea phototrophica]EDQ35675.1 ABC-type sugar transport system, ATPase component [Hoeflea phototrophica DFL-43]
MASITLDKLAHSYSANPKTDADFALKEIDYQWEDGGAYALLGPSGCGKTTLLNIISGLLVPSKGHIKFDGQDVTHLQPEERNIAQVFQFPVIYDTMTVRQNLAFPLINRRVPQDEITQRVNDMIEVLDLSDKADRRARGLTADEKQKISLGRGLVRYDVNAILFDEPLTVIDPHMKWQLRTKLKDLHRQLGHTMIYVTHDQTEALTFADKVVVMYEGEVVQIGTPEELFNEPAHTFVGYFIGSPGMNVIPCEINGKTANVGNIQIELPAGYKTTSAKTELGVRPEFVSLSSDKNGLPVQIDAVENIGRFKIVRANLQGHSINALLKENEEVPADPTLSFETARINVYENSHLVRAGA